MSENYENDMGMERKSLEEGTDASGQQAGYEAGQEPESGAEGGEPRQDRAEQEALQGNPTNGNDAYGSPTSGNDAYGNPAYGNNAYGNNAYGNASYGTPDNHPNAYGGNPYGQNGQTYGQPYPGYYVAGSRRKKDGIAFGVASLVLGIVTIVLFCFCISWITGILAIVFGIVQLVKYEKKGLAIGGIITGAVGLLLTILLYGLMFSDLDSMHRYNSIYDHIYDDIYDEFYDEFYDGV